MITEDHVSFETAKLLKEKGFDENTPVNYFVGDDKHRGCMVGEMIYHKRIEEDTHLIACPTLQMAMKWLREVHNYDISICLDSYVEPYDNEYYIVIRRRKDKYENVSPCEQVYFNTYEEACEEAIRYCLENLI